jgi:hypothetical protein
VSLYSVVIINWFKQIRKDNNNVKCQNIKTMHLSVHNTLGGELLDKLRGIELAE